MARLLERIFPPCHPTVMKIACRYRTCPWEKTLPRTDDDEAVRKRLERAYATHVRAKHGTPVPLSLITGGAE